MSLSDVSAAGLRIQTALTFAATEFTMSPLGNRLRVLKVGTVQCEVFVGDPFVTLRMESVNIGSRNFLSLPRCDGSQQKSTLSFVSAI